MVVTASQFCVQCSFMLGSVVKYTFTACSDPNHTGKAEVYLLFTYHHDNRLTSDAGETSPQALSFFSV